MQRCGQNSASRTLQCEREKSVYILLMMFCIATADGVAIPFRCCFSSLFSFFFNVRCETLLVGKTVWHKTAGGQINGYSRVSDNKHVCSV